MGWCGLFAECLSDRDKKEENEMLAKKPAEHDSSREQEEHLEK